MKKVVQGPGSDLSLGQGHLLAHSQVEMEADPCVCRIKRTSTSTEFTLSRGKTGGGQEAGKEGGDEVPLSWAGCLRVPRPSLRQSPCNLGVPELLASEGLLELQSCCPRAGWRQGLEEREGPGPPGKPAAGVSNRPPPRDRSVDVIEYIVKELQGIGRLQTEIAELQQHLTLIKGSVDEVSSCVDTVLSEIEGLQSSGSSSGRTSSAVPKARRQSLQEPPCLSKEEPVLYFYGLQEREGEDTKELVCSFLSEYHCFNGIHHSRYIQEAYRASGSTGVPLAPRPAVVRFADEAQRDFILQKSILLQRAGVVVVARGEQSLPNGRQGGRLEGQGDAVPSPGQGPAPWDSVAPQGDVLRTDGDGQFQLDFGQGPQEGTSQECHRGEEALRGAQHQSTFAGEGRCRTEPKEPTGGVWPRTGRNEHPLPNSATPSWNLEAAASSELPEGHRPKHQGPNARPSAEGFSVVVGKEPAMSEEEGRALEAADASREGSFLVEEDKAGGPTPGESETEGEASTLECLSPEQGSLLEEAPAVTLPGCESPVRKWVGSSETLKDMIQMDLNEQDPTEQVFRDVLENSQYFLEHSRDSLDLVDVRFYTNKLGKALGHFRSALQVVFHKLETGDPEVFLEADKSLHVAHEPPLALGSSSTHSNLENLADSPPSPSSESQANTALSSDSGALAGRGEVPAGLLAPDEAPASAPQPPPDAGSGGPEPLSSGPAQPDGCRPMSLEKVCAETIYLNKCINNFKNVLREKRQMRRRLLKELAQEASWTASTEEMPSGTWLTPRFPLNA